MLNRFPLLILPGALLVQCAPAVSAGKVSVAVVQKEAEPVIRNRQELNAAVAAWVDKAYNPINFRLTGTLRSNWKEISGESLWGEYARRCTARYIEETGQVSLTLEYRDYVRLCAALRHPAFRESLTSAEERVLLELQTRTQRIVRPGMSAFDKVVAVHDYLVQITRYDAEAGGDISDLLEKGRGSCEAYSSAMCVMLEIAGVPARVVTGTARGPHAWNMVQLDTGWRHVDVTWDDPVIGDGSKQVLAHTYCGCTDTEMSATHRWNRAAYPACTGAAQHYYRQKGLYFTSVSAYWNAAMRVWRRGEKHFEAYLTTYGSAAQFQKSLQQIVRTDSPGNLRWTGPETPAGPVMMSFGTD